MAARISEQFDCEVLELPENRFIAGKRLAPEIVERASTSWREGKWPLRDWYPASVGAAPLKYARIICQRANLQFDSELRKSYANMVTIFGVAVAALLVAIGIWQDFRFVEFLTTTVPPAGPILIWALRESFRQRDAAATNDGVRHEAESFWDAATSQNLGDDVCKARSREFQDAIFRHRSTSPLIFPGVYDKKRAQLESEMKAAAIQMLRQTGIQA